MIKKALDALDKGLTVFLMIVIAVFTGIIFIQVICRYVFDSPLSWSEQVGRYMFIWTVMLGTPLCFRHNINVVFDLVVNKFPKVLQFAVDLFNHCLILAFSVFYFIHGMELCILAKGKILAGIDIPNNLVYSAQPVCAALLFIFCLEMMWDKFVKPLVERRKAGA